MLGSIRLEVCIYLVNSCWLDVSLTPKSGLARLERLFFTTRPEPELDSSYPKKLGSFQLYFLKLISEMWYELVKYWNTQKS